jgi:ribosome hibernation promoting factor
MLIEIRARDFPLTDGIRTHIKRRLNFALDRFARRVRAVLVWVGDVNGPKHGADDKFCRLAVQLPKQRAVLEERASDLYVAIDRVAHRVRKKIARKLKRAYRPAAYRIQAQSLMR